MNVSPSVESPRKPKNKRAAITKAKADVKLNLRSLTAALASCRSLEDVRDIHDKAKGIESFMRARGVGADGLADAAELIVRAERRLGEILDELPKHPGNRNGSGGSEDEPPKLEDLGVSKKQSSRWQALASIPDEDFEAAIFEAREKQKRISGTSLIRAAKGDGEDAEDHPGGAWLDDQLNEHGWVLTGAQRATVLATWKVAGEDAALEMLKAIAWSQWDTREDLADAIVELAELSDTARVLEPSAGRGALVRAIRKSCPDAEITAIEIDPARCALLQQLVDEEILNVVREGDFLSVELGEQSFDASISNTPYENGADGKHLAHQMQLAPRVVAVLRTNALHGSERFERVWKRCKPAGDWGLHTLIYLASRPDFESVIADGNARSDFVLVRLDRGYRGKTHVDWFE